MDLISEDLSHYLGIYWIINTFGVIAAMVIKNLFILVAGFIAGLVFMVYAISYVAVRAEFDRDLDGVTLYASTKNGRPVFVLNAQTIPEMMRAIIVALSWTVRPMKKRIFVANNVRGKIICSIVAIIGITLIVYGVLLSVSIVDFTQ